MSIKDQEREALKKIREIVEGLGEDSYIAAAFEGCFEIAEDNINNDFGDSWMDRWSAAVKENETARKEAREARAEAEELKEQLNILKNNVK